MSDLPQTSQTDTSDEPGREAHLDYVQDVRDAVWDRDTRWLARLLGRLHPADAADLLEQLSGDDFAACVDLLGGQLPTSIIIELRDEYRVNQWRNRGSEARCIECQVTHGPFAPQR